MAPLREKQDRERGFILVVVLWAAILLALWAAGFAASVRNHVRATATAMERTRAEALADGGINLALLDLSSARQDRAYVSRFSGSEGAHCRMEADSLLTIRIEDEAGKINLNLAGERLLNAYFIASGATPDAAAGYTDRLIDYRDSDDAPRPRGAERDDYAAQSRRPPKNAPFDVVDELDQVLGLAGGVAAAAKAYATVHSGLNGVDGDQMQPQLRAALVQAARESGSLGSAARPAAATFDDSELPAEFSGRSTQQAFTVYATARLASGVVYVSQAVVEFRPAQGYVLRQWRHGNAATAGTSPDAAETDPPPC